ncbi:GtrA family protein [candidate division WWE3 bacterium]|nr:GtrA family protein [candidate division WWE3 bacterium]
MKQHNHTYRLSKFLLIGALATLIDLALYVILCNRLHLIPSVAASVSFSCSTLINFSLNNRITFLSSDRTYFEKIARFYTVAIGGLILTYLGISLLTMSFGFDYLIAKVCVVILVTIYNYLLQSRVTFNVSQNNLSRS